MTATHSLWQEAFDAVATDVLQRGGVVNPPVDAVALAERLGAAVAFDAAQQARGRQKRLGGRPSIFLRPEDRPERLQWAAAHELGEVVAHEVFERVAHDEDEVPPAWREEAANRLASLLLLPSWWFFSDARRLDGDVLRLKHVYRTASHELIALRLLDLPERSIVTIIDDGRLTRRKWNGWGRPPALLPAERACRLEAHEQNRSARRRLAAVEIQAWPVHEEGWKREIVRTRMTGGEEEGEPVESEDEGLPIAG